MKRTTDVFLGSAEEACDQDRARPAALDRGHDVIGTMGRAKTGA
jgi:hypothetical protein